MMVQEKIESQELVRLCKELLLEIANVTHSKVPDKNIGVFVPLYYSLVVQVAANLLLNADEGIRVSLEKSLAERSQK